MTHAEPSGKMPNVSARPQASSPSPENTGGSGERDASGRFKPGTSGNPGGRPKGVAQAARRFTGPDGRKYLKEVDAIAMDPNQKTGDRIECLKIMLERGHGKAPAFAPIEGENPLELDDVTREVAATLDELAARREAAAARQGEAPVVADTSPG